MHLHEFIPIERAPLEWLNSQEPNCATTGGAATKLDIVALCMQIEALQNIDCCDDFNAGRRSAIR